MSLDVPKEIDSYGSILFLGSGFSKSAKNIRDENLPTGQGLKEQLARILNVNPNLHNLMTLADEVASRQDLNLYQILYELFTVKEIQPYQDEILKLPWRRIYTTNYDDTVEFSYLKNQKNAPSFTCYDQKPKKLLNGSIIHLHGVIRSATEQNVLDQLVLNENAYIRQHFEKSPWYDDFYRDLRFCTACFFVGYSLTDHHITALLMQNPSVRDRTYFVTRKDPDKIFLNRIKPYGTVLPIEVEGFATLCRTLPKPAPTSAPHALKAFRYLDPFKDKKTLAPPTAVEILNLVTYGAFNFQRCLSTLPGGEYVVPRQNLADEAAAQLKDARCLLVHSRLGNGKSIFLHILAYKLSEQGYLCFLCVPNPLVSQQDFELLQTFKKVAIFFDSYNTAIEFVEQFAEALPEAKYIVAVRTSVQEVRLHEIQSRLPAPLKRVNLNGMQIEDVEAFKKLLDRSGVRAPDLEQAIDRCKDFRDVVLALYDHRQINEKIKNELAPLLRERNFRNVFVASHLLELAGQNIDTGFLHTVTQSDAYAELAKFREISGDVFKLDDESVHIRSSIFSEYIITNHLKTSEITDVLYTIIVEAVKRIDERRFQAILSSLMRFSMLDRILNKDQNRINSLLILFDRLHRDISVNQEPLFWLQYSILMTAAGDLCAAERFINTAYSRAAARPGFQTFQIDTYALGLMLRIEQRANDQNTILRFDQIMDKMERVRSMIGDDSRRFHAVQVLEDIEPFVSARISSFSIHEKTRLVYHLTLIIGSLDQLSPKDRAQTGSDRIKASVTRARDRLLA